MEGEPRTSAALLRQARLSASLSQADVARRAHVAQSVISAYESGRREPALSTLERLIAATGLVGTDHALRDVGPSGHVCLRQRRAQPGLPEQRGGRSWLSLHGESAYSGSSIGDSPLRSAPITRLNSSIRPIPEASDHAW